MNQKENIRNQYDELMETLKSVDESYNLVKDNILVQLDQVYLNYEVLDNILTYTQEYIDNADDNTVNTDFREFLANHSSTEEAKTGYLSDTPVEVVKKIMSKTKELSLLLIKTKKETIDVHKNFESAIDEFMSYTSTSKVNADKKDQIKHLKEKVNEETDDKLREEMISKINTLESALYFNFLFDNFTDVNKNEVKNIMDGFFDDKKGKYIVDKYIKKNHLFGYKDKFPSSFINIEETFLPEEYLPFNNLLLYIYMRFISYADPYSEKDKTFVHALTGAITNLIYHKFDNTDEEQEFINVIKKVLDNFIDYTDEFKEKNTTYKLHPLRIESEREHDKNRRKALIKKITDMKLDVSDVNLDELSADEIQDITIQKLMN